MNFADETEAAYFQAAIEDKLTERRLRRERRMASKRQSQNGSTSQNGNSTPLNTSSNEFQSFKESLPFNNQQQQPTHQGNLLRGIDNKTVRR